MSNFLYRIQSLYMWPQSQYIGTTFGSSTQLQIGLSQASNSTISVYYGDGSSNNFSFDASLPPYSSTKLKFNNIVQIT